MRYEVVFHGPGGARTLYDGEDLQEAYRICYQVITTTPALRP